MALESGAPRVLVVAEYGARLRVHRHSIVVETREGRVTVPVAQVDRIVLATSKISVTTAAIRRLARLGIDILVLDALGRPIVTITPPWMTATAATRLAQYRAATDKSMRLAIASRIIAAKIESQASLLETLETWMGVGGGREEAERLHRLAREALSAPSVERLRVIEATAARRYWRLYREALPPDVGFEGRDPDATDDVNTTLNYLYGLLYAWVNRYLVMHGLDPYVGFIHVDRSGAETLVYDIAELFRTAAVDALALQLYRGGWRPRRSPETGLLEAEARAELVKHYSRWVRSCVVVDGATGRKAPIEEHMRLQARHLASTLARGNPLGYTPFHARAGKPCPISS